MTHEELLKLAQQHVDNEDYKTEHGIGHLGGALKPWEASMIIRDYLALSVKLEEVQAERDQLLSSLKAVIETDDDCPLCDRGRLRNPQKTHWPECPFGRAGALIAQLQFGALEASRGEVVKACPQCGNNMAQTEFTDGTWRCDACAAAYNEPALYRRLSGPLPWKGQKQDGE